MVRKSPGRVTVMLSIVIALALLEVPASAQQAERGGIVWKTSPEVAEYVQRQIGEPVWTLCPELETLPEGFEEECSAGTKSGKNFKVKFRVTKAGESIDIVSLTREADDPAWHRLFDIGPSALPVFVIIGGVLSLFGFVRMLKTKGSSYIGELFDPAPQRTVHFDGPGSYFLYVDGMKFGNEMHQVKVALWDPVGAAWVNSLPALQGRNTFALRWAKEIFHVPRGGEFVLTMYGLEALPEPPRSRLIFGRSVIGRYALYLLLGIAGAMMFLVSLILLTATHS